MTGLDRVGQGFMQQTTRLAQRATAGLALQAERQPHVFQEREEAEALLAADDHAVTIGEQAVAGRPGDCACEPSVRHGETGKEHVAINWKSARYITEIVNGSVQNSPGQR